MEQYHYTINNQGTIEDLTIYRPSEENGRYRVELEGSTVGYLYFSQMDEHLACPIWEGTTPSLSLIAAELGSFIERSDIGLPGA